MTVYEQLLVQLRTTPRVWLITGVAGFIGSNLLEKLLLLDQRVIGLDNFSAGHRHNLDEVRAAVSPAQWARFQFQEGDIADLAACRRATAGVEFVLHHAALGSVPLSMNDPLACHRANVTGFLNLLIAARDAGVKRFVYATSSAVYGDDPATAKTEAVIGRPLSPYAASKRMNEIYADTFAMSFGFASVGLRYFNIFGPRQDPEGAYAAVIPRWIAALLRREPVYINGDGETTRDFCYVGDVIQANLLAATTENPEALNQVFNVALGRKTSLNELFGALQTALRRRDAALPETQSVYREFRAGDVRHSQAEVGKARRLLGFEPAHDLAGGLELAMDWYRRNTK
jgi:UDP-N-acetylglucosamine 4-epimerase